MAKAIRSTPPKTPARGDAEAAVPADPAPGPVKVRKAIRSERRVATDADGESKASRPVRPLRSERAAKVELPTVCPYPAAELKKWREFLVVRRQEISGDIGSLERSAMDQEEGHVAPTHQADRGSDADLQDTNLRMVENERVLLWQIDRAIRKIDTGKPIPFGLCEHTLKPIANPRLQVLPWTPLSIEGSEHMEDNGLSLEDMIIDE